MKFVFGRFELDRAARVLRLDGRDVAMQPRVFDLLVYLVEHRARVVPKEELLDALWPGVTVTEASLQRAVSLARAALREGGLAEAIRSAARVGYRFCAEVTPRGSGQAGAGGHPGGASVDPKAAAEAALHAQCWSEADALYRQADAAGLLTAADLDRWAHALECLGRPSEAIPLLTRAVNAHAQAEAAAAAESAIALARIHLERGELAVCRGWVARAARCAGEDGATRAHGLVLWMQARIASEDGEPARAHDLADRAYAVGKALRDCELESLGLIYRGFYRLCLGDTLGGLQDQDHAAALALSGNVDPITGSTIYCAILWGCRTFGDWARAQQWTAGYRQWCMSARMGYAGACQLHRAEVLGVQGSLQEALALVNDALARLPADAPWALGDANRVLGDIHAMIGDDAAAMACYDKAYALGWDGEPGRAMLLLERGEADAAYASLERCLIGKSWWTLQRQGILLAHLALVAACSGKAARAQALIDDLSGQAERWPAPAIRALTNEASATLALARGDAAEAIRHLHLARQLWTSVESRYHAARLRIRIAELLRQIGDDAGAATELRVACTAAAELGSHKLARRCAGAT
jgi:DNA-binding winged helix-turn-helix (wHTH) protein/ATP/maltotriose-dependent transcriptional regulator MalT